MVSDVSAGTDLQEKEHKSEIVVEDLLLLKVDLEGQTSDAVDREDVLNDVLKDHPGVDDVFIE